MSLPIYFLTVYLSQVLYKLILITIYANTYIKKTQFLLLNEVYPQNVTFYLKINFFLDIFIVWNLMLSKKIIIVYIIKTQILHNIKFNLKCHKRIHMVIRYCFYFLILITDLRFYYYKIVRPYKVMITLTYVLMDNF